MKKLITTALVTGLLLALGAGFAQRDSASHDVRITIPEVLFLRITDGTSNDAVTDAEVGFDFETNVEAYLTHIETLYASDPFDGDLGWIASTDSAASFGDVVVLSNVSWEVTVTATRNEGTFDLERVRVTPSGAYDGSIVTSRETEWTLEASSAVASGVQTSGWAGLGIRATDYEIYVDGTEDEGETVIEVTYTISDI